MPLDPYKLAVFALVSGFLLLLYFFGKSSNQFTTSGLHERPHEK
jgi:hypothetical protein